MSFSKWIGAAIGWSFGGPIGAVIGMALGSLVDNLSEERPKIGSGRRRRPGPQSKQKHPYRDTRPKTQSGDFEVSLLILASIVIKSDGKKDQRELEFVRQKFLSMYGKERANHAFDLFKAVSKQKVSKRQVSMQIRQMMDHASRLQLLHFLFGIAKADGLVSDDELHTIHTISGYLGISQKDFESIKAMFYDKGLNAYKILELEEKASDAEVKNAYRSMVKKYHPDRVSHLGPEHQKGAEEKFRQVQEAYEYIQEKRGFK
jgi:DnaJ like chaperone protein